LLALVQQSDYTIIEMHYSHKKAETTTMRLASACLLVGVAITTPSVALAQGESPAVAHKPAKPAVPRPKPAPTAAVASGAVTTPKFLEKQGSWSIYMHDAPNDRICFASSTPSSAEPKGVKRGPVYFYVTTWRKDNVHAEVSVSLGYAIKADVPPMITVGSESFELFARNNKAFTRDPQEEKRLLDAMMKATVLTVKGTPLKGSATVDQYSLSGLVGAMKKVDQSCQ
jgi:hypothetical protein